MCVALEGAGRMGGGSPAQPFLQHHARGGGCKPGVHSPGKGAAEAVPTKLGSRTGFLPAFPPHKCTLDQNSVIPVKWHRISKCRCFDRGVFPLQCFSQSLNTIGLI